MFFKLRIRTTLLVLMMQFYAVYANAHTYYVDNIHGNDNNDGHSAGKAWKTLDKLNNTLFEQGDKIFLKRGQIFKGSLHLKGEGTASQPIICSAYGTGRRPIISSAGFDYSVQLMDTQSWEISDIETSGSDKAGIYIGCTKNNLVMDYFRITNCYVHDIGDTTKLAWDFSTTTGGIIIANSSLGTDGMPAFYGSSVFNDVVINNCTVRYNYRWTCISITSGKANDARGNANYIRNCTAEYSSADGIRMNGVQNSFIEYCVMYRNGAWPNYPGKNLGGLGAWFFDAENCTIQFCEASDVRGRTSDAGAFDIDFWQKNSTVQYCYGHDCAGYGVSVFGADSSFPTENATVRYNILSNNGRDSSFAWQGDFFVFTWNGGLLNGVKIYNNTSYWNAAVDTPDVRIDADFTGINQNIFTNNIIYSKRKHLVYLKSDTMRCDNNIYWLADNTISVWQRKDKTYYSLAEWQQNTKQETHSQYTNPMIEDPTYHERGFPVTQFNLKQGSPGINTGMALQDMGNRDFFGNAIPDKSG
ncbi:MAG TPA: right-handed parallel beta-helix repeat-containing protein, partial [Chitinophagaceae bacterium]